MAAAAGALDGGGCAVVGGVTALRGAAVVGVDVAGVVWLAAGEIGADVVPATEVVNVFDGDADGGSATGRSVVRLAVFVGDDAVGTGDDTDGRETDRDAVTEGIVTVPVNDGATDASGGLELPLQAHSVSAAAEATTAATFEAWRRRTLAVTVAPFPIVDWPVGSRSSGRF